MYKVQSHPMDDYVTGTNRAGEPVMFGLLYPQVCCVLFDNSGKLVEVRLRQLRVLAKAVRKGGPYIIEDPDFQDKLKDQIRSWQNEIGFKEHPIAIERFAIPQLRLGIAEMPPHFQDFKNDPDDSTEEDRREMPAMIDQWLAEGNFVLWWWTDYYLDAHGEII